MCDTVAPIQMPSPGDDFASRRKSAPNPGPRDPGPRPVVSPRSSAARSPVSLSDGHEGGGSVATAPPRGDLQAKKPAASPKAAGAGGAGSYPEAFVCPLTHKLFLDPVFTCDGITYDRKAIEEWFRQGNKSSPVTGDLLEHTDLVPNLAIRRAVDQYLALNR